jgi:Ras-related protein Rab-1A
MSRKHIRARVDKNPKNFAPYEFNSLFKIVMIGESGAGKTSMLLRFTDGTFDDGYLCTIGVDFKIKTMQADDNITKM